MAICPHCGNGGFIAKPYPEESHCDHCGASFFGSDKAVFATHQKLTCKKCGRIWAYTGEKAWSPDYPVYTSCPRCKGNVRIPRP
jgi:ribosomal protein S27AE